MIEKTDKKIDKKIDKVVDKKFQRTNIRDFLKIARGMWGIFFKLIL
jgi:hypothetical protein